MHRRTLLAFGAVMVGGTPAKAQDNFSRAIGVFASERSLAEQDASFLKAYAPEDIDARALYARAKAAFDGLIEQLLADLAQGHDPAVSDLFRAQVDQAIDRRLEFSRQVDADRKRVLAEGAKPGWADALAASAGELVKQVFDGGIAVWNEWRTASAERRKEMATRLDAQRWKPFAEIPAVR